MTKLTFPDGKTKEVEMTPCPFCGGEELFLQKRLRHELPQTFEIRCKNAKCVNRRGTPEAAIDAWNYRVVATVKPKGDE